VTEQMERYLRHMFATDGERAPVAQDLAQTVRARVRRERRRRGTVAASGVGVIGLVAGISLALSPEKTPSTPGKPPTTATSPIQRGTSPTERGTHSVLRFRGVEVPVPAHMLDPRNRRCGTTQKDSAYVFNPPEAGRDCLAPVKHPELITEVVLQPWTLPQAFDSPPPGERVLGDGRTQLVTRIPDRDVRLVVTSPDPDRAQRLFDGVRLVNEADGCAVMDRGDRPTPVESAKGPMVPVEAQGGSVCGYRDGWLVDSHQLAPHEAAQLADVLNAAPEGLGPSGPTCSAATTNHDAYREPHWLVRLGARDEYVNVWVYGEACLPSGAVNDSGRTGQLTVDMISLLYGFTAGPTTFGDVLGGKT